MKRDSHFGQLLYAVQRYLIFFIMVAFVITCCMILFVTILAETLEVSLTGEILSDAARLTFLNVLFLSLI